MRIESKLCHISENKAVVQVNGWLNDRNLGSALAEGPTVEVAEDKAISRLNERIKADTKDVSSINTNNEHNDDKWQKCGKSASALPRLCCCV